MSNTTEASARIPTVDVRNFLPDDSEKLSSISIAVPLLAREYKDTDSADKLFDDLNGGIRKLPRDKSNNARFGSVATAGGYVINIDDVKYIDHDYHGRGERTVSLHFHKSTKNEIDPLYSKGARFYEGDIPALMDALSKVMGNAGIVVDKEKTQKQLEEQIAKQNSHAFRLGLEKDEGNLSR